MYSDVDPSAKIWPWSLASTWIGLTLVALPPLGARVPASQLLFVANALGNSNISAGYSSPGNADNDFTPLDLSSFGSFTTPARTLCGEYVDEAAFDAYIRKVGTKKNILAEITSAGFSDASVSITSKAEELVDHFVKSSLALRKSDRCPCPSMVSARALRQSAQRRQHRLGISSVFKTLSPRCEDWLDQRSFPRPRTNFLLS